MLQVLIVLGVISVALAGLIVARFVIRARAPAMPSGDARRSSQLGLEARGEGKESRP